MSVIDSFSVSGKTALITGAGRGIGKCLALGLADAGAEITAVDIDGATAQTTADEIAALGRDALAIATDVTQSDQVQSMAQTHLDRFGRIDILVNNAGIAAHVPVEDMALEDWDKMMALNVRALFEVSQVVGRTMLEQGSGAIINIASMSGSIVNQPQCQAAYNTSKAAVVMLTKSMAGEWAKRGVRVNCISPGYTATEMTMMPTVREMHPTWEALIPMGRLAQPGELVGAAIYLASDASSYVTGHDLAVDGGYTLW